MQYLSRGSGRLYGKVHKLYQTETGLSCSMLWTRTGLLHRTTSELLRHYSPVVDACNGAFPLG
jgi:hypothetical protein